MEKQDKLEQALVRVKEEKRKQKKTAKQKNLIEMKKRD
jgi:hypothetical protein